MSARFFILEPKARSIEQFVAQLAGSELSYSEIGMTARRAKPPGYHVLSYQYVVGHGRLEFERTVQALKHWTQMELDWVQVCKPKPKMEKGANVVIKARHFGIWSLNACRIVLTADDGISFSFANGTLKEHALRGEERFSVRLQEDGSVLYEIYSFFCPGILATLLYPAVLWLQHKFLSDSVSALLATNTHNHYPT
jgi:uncharacterized protein (UPF0548 family)